MKNRYFVKGGPGCVVEIWERVSSRATQRLFVETKSRTAKKVARVLNLATSEDPAIVVEMLWMLQVAKDSGFSSVQIDVEHLERLLSVYVAAQELTK